jgi:hypothetical protein
VSGHLLPPQAAVGSSLYKNTDVELFLPISPFLPWNRLRAIKTEPVPLSAPSSLDAEHRNHPKKATRKPKPWPSAIPSRVPPFGPSLAPFLREVRSSCPVLHPGTF